MVGFVLNSARRCFTGSRLILGRLQRVLISLGNAFRWFLIHFRRSSGVGTFDIGVVGEQGASSKDVTGGVCRGRRCGQQLVPIFVISLSRKMG